MNLFFLLDMPDFTSAEVWISLLTLTFLEIVLGVDNIIFITITSNRLSDAQKPKARTVGLFLAMVFRIALLFGITSLIALSEPFLVTHGSFCSIALSGQSLILFAGGIFLLYKSVTEIHHKLEGRGPEESHSSSPVASTLVNAVIQICLINIVFSFDSILTAIGLTDDVVIMIIAVVISVLIMMGFAGPVGKFVNDHPTIQMLGMAFLLLIGFMLIAEAAHLGKLKFAGAEVGEVPKGYLYFAIAFSLLVEALNLRLRKSRTPVQLHGISEQAESEGAFKHPEKPK